MQIHKIIHRIYRCFCVIFISIFFVLWLFTYSAKTTLDIWGLITKWISNLSKKTVKISGKAVVQDLYDINLSSINVNLLQPLDDSIQDTVISLNSICNCNLSKQDVINILYYADGAFQRDIKNLAWNKFEEPNSAVMSESCYKFNKGVYEQATWDASKIVKTTPSFNTLCQKNVADVFIKMYVNKKNKSSVGDSVKDSEAFWNGTLDDSSYDLLVDVYDVAKLLFVDPQEPPKVYYYSYSMPTLSNVDGTYNYKVPTEIDWFSPYNNTTTTMTQVQNSGSDVIYGSGSNTNWDSQTSWNNNFNGNVDPDIVNFVTTVTRTNTETTNPETIYLWNECVSWFSYQFYESGEIVETWVDLVFLSGEMTADEYMEEILESIQSLQCNNDYICQSRETPSCPDCVWTSWWVSDLEEIEEILNSIEEIWDEELDEMTVACISNCFQTQKTVDSQLLCVAKCMCNTIESPFFDPVEYPWLSPIFKLKFCVIPVSDLSGVWKTKKASNVESIFTEIYKLLETLRNSWELMVAEKTREMMDSSYKKSNIASQLSFTIVSSKASHVSQPSQASKDQTQIDANTTYMSDILWFSKDVNDRREINKYVVADDPCKYVLAGNAAATSVENNESLLKSCNEEREKNKYVPNLTGAVEDIDNTKMDLLTSSYSEFMAVNANYWKEINDMLESIAYQSNVLLQKNNK